MSENKNNIGRFPFRWRRRDNNGIQFTILKNGGKEAETSFQFFNKRMKSQAGH